MEDISATADKDGLAFVQEQMAKYKDEQYVKGWDSLWNSGKKLPWDKHMPHPALVEMLVEKMTIIGGPIVETAVVARDPETHEIINDSSEKSQGSSPPAKVHQGSPSMPSQRRKKALVPGCGRGVDVLLLASFGYDAYGLEYSEMALEACKQELEQNGHKYPVHDNTIGAGKVTFVQGDFFDDAWFETLGLTRHSFDLIYDYTFFCALQPHLRPKWALRHTQLLTLLPEGCLVCLEFPTHKDPKAQGPPYAAPSKAYWAHLTHPGEEILYASDGSAQTGRSHQPSPLGLERVGHWQPRESHESNKDGQGRIHDWVAVWRRPI